MSEKNQFGPEEEFEDLDLDNISMGLSEDDLDDVYDSLRGNEFRHARQTCRVRTKRSEVEGSLQDDWLAGVRVSWDDEFVRRAQELFQSDIWDTNGKWIEVRVGHESGSANRELAEEEAEWLAEQVVMLENDPNVPV